LSRIFPKDSTNIVPTLATFYFWCLLMCKRLKPDNCDSKHNFFCFTFTVQHAQRFWHFFDLLEDRGVFGALYLCTESERKHINHRLSSFMRHLMMYVFKIFKNLTKYVLSYFIWDAPQYLPIWSHRHFPIVFLTLMISWVSGAVMWHTCGFQSWVHWLKWAVSCGLS